MTAAIPVDVAHDPAASASRRSVDGWRQSLPTVLGRRRYADHHTEVPAPIGAAHCGGLDAFRAVVSLVRSGLSDPPSAPMQ